MKKIQKNNIINISNTDLFDHIFQFDIFMFPSLELIRGESCEIIHMSDLLEKKKNIEILEKVKEKPAMYSEVYSPKDELEIFTQLFDDALKNKKRIHIVGITLKEEIQILEKYYTELWFFDESVNVFKVDFSVPLITASLKIENLMWKGSDYKRMREKIFFNPPVRESGQNKALFKGINRWVIAGVFLSSFEKTEQQEFLQTCIVQEKILPITMGRILKYNFEEIGIQWEEKKLEISYL